MRGDINEAIRTYTGLYVWPMNPRPEDIDLIDVAHALARINRFNGHTAQPYSVAEHAVRVSRLVEELASGVHGPAPHAPGCVRRSDGLVCSCGSLVLDGALGVQALALWGLHHDDSEYLLVDLPSPVKKGNHVLGMEYQAAEARVMKCVCRRFRLPAFEPYIVQAADRILLYIEQRDLMNAGPNDQCDCSPFTELAENQATLLPGTYAQAEQAFLQRHRDLTATITPAAMRLGPAVARQLHGDGLS